MVWEGASVKPSTTLRLEFLLPGFATIAALAWLVIAMAALWGGQPIDAVTDAVDFEITTAWAVVAGAVLLGVAYVVGIAVVMATFRWPVRHLLLDAQVDRLQELAPLVSEDRRRCEILLDQFRPETPRPTHRSPQHRLGRVLTTRPVDPHVGLALSLARSSAQPGVVSEFEYRRYVRQLGAGVLPAVVFATAAAVLTDWSVLTHDHAASWTIRLSSLAAGLLLTWVLLSAIRYQEHVGQSLLLDTALLELLSERDSSSSVLTTVPAEGLPHSSGRRGLIRVVAVAVAAVALWLSRSKRSPGSR
jgi:hypothetical protein